MVYGCLFAVSLVAGAHVAHPEQWCMPSYCVLLLCDVYGLDTSALFGMGNKNCPVFTTLTKTLSETMCAACWLDRALFLRPSHNCLMVIIDNNNSVAYNIYYGVLICESIYRYCLHHRRGHCQREIATKSLWPSKGDDDGVPLFLCGIAVMPA